MGLVTSIIQRQGRLKLAAFDVGKYCPSLFWGEFRSHQPGSLGQCGIPLVRQILTGRQHHYVWFYADMFKALTVPHHQISVCNSVTEMA